MIDMQDNSIFEIYTFLWGIFTYNMLDFELGFERYEYLEKYLNLPHKRKIKKKGRKMG